MNNQFTYEHWEAQDEYIILHNGPIGYTVCKLKQQTMNVC
jgi:hypothetical protein